MNSDDEVAMPNEVVIVRRRPVSDGEGHHGGAWKIAYADFMTAMMAFFLVMWLISASDDETVTQIANYFNPINLNDEVRSTKGLSDANSKSEQKGDGNKKEKAGSEKERSSKVMDDLAEGSEKELFDDPYGLLARLAAKAEEDLLARAALSDDDSKGKGAGEVLRDPFAPDFWRGAPAVEARKRQAKGRVSPDDNAPKVNADRPKPGPEPAAEDAAKVPAKPAAAGKPSPLKAAKTEAALLEAKQLEHKIAKAMQALSPAKTPFIEVKRTPEGLLISITDQFDFGMFDIASAKPRPELVLVMERLAKVILGRREKLVLRGHTDGRPFRSKTYDNWRLATARAHMAHYMLVRGGIPESRFARVEGYADKMLRIKANRLAAQNRRIEILLRKSRP